jgi:hypothetical protein
MIQKRDYTQTKTLYKSLVPKTDAVKLAVGDEDKRDKAELLDAVEDMAKGGKASFTLEKLRALFSTLVYSSYNHVDDSIDANAIDWSNIPTSAPRVSGKVYVDRGIVKIS